MASEADRAEKINRASGEAEAIELKARAVAVSIAAISEAIKTNGHEAVGLMVADKYMDAFRELAKEGTTLLLPSQASDPASMISTAMSIFKSIKTNQQS